MRTFCKPFSVSESAKYECANAAPILRSTVLSDRSRCIRERQSLSANMPKSAFDSSKFPSLFSKLIGLTLCGIVDDPTSPACVSS